MCPSKPSQKSITEIMKTKEDNREQLIRAFRESSPEARDAAVQRLREAMRKPEGSKGRARWHRSSSLDQISSD